MAGSNDNKYTLPADFAKHYAENSPGNRRIERETTYELIQAATSAPEPWTGFEMKLLFPGPHEDFDIRRNPLGFDIHKDPLVFFVPGGSTVVWASPVTDFHRPGEVRMSSIHIEVALTTADDELLQALAGQVNEASGGVFRLHANLSGEVHQPELWDGLTDLEPHSALFLDQRTSWISTDQWGSALASVCAGLVGSLNLWGALKIQALDITRLCREENGVLVHRAPRGAFSGLVGGDGAVRYAYGDLDGTGNIWGTEPEIKLLEQWQAAS